MYPLPVFPISESYISETFEVRCHRAADTFGISSMPFMAGMR